MAKVKKPKKFKLRKKMQKLLQTGAISGKILNKLRGSQIPIRKPRGGVGKGMAGM